MRCPACFGLRSQNSAVSILSGLIKRYSSTSSSRPLKLAIVGAGPSGFYAASRILSSIPVDSPRGQDVRVDMYERLPTPYGLARYGVAPDHPEVKNCQHKFDELSTDSRFTFYGNVSIGSQPSSSGTSSPPRTALSRYTYPHALHLPFKYLLEHYTTVLLTYGASLSNPLNVPGSSSSSNPLDGVYPALALVGWYNGHPAFTHLSPDFSNVTDLTVIGHGNVALDVSRILLKRPEDLAHTDIPESVLDTLSKSRISNVTAVGRRGPGQVAFTTKEFREMLNLPGVSYTGLSGAMVDEAKAMVENDRMKKRLLGLMEKSSDGGQGGASKSFKLDFLKSPKRFTGDTKVTGVEWTINQLLTAAPAGPATPSSQVPSQPKGGVVARPTDLTNHTATGMIVESVGYRSEPLGVGEEWSVPFDSASGKVRNVGGRIVDESGAAVPGLYAAGWAARGPVGVIASTMHDAYALSDLMLDDHFAPDPAQKTIEDGVPEAVEKGLKEGRVVTLDRWQKIDQAERQRAKDKGLKKAREKFINVEDMLAVI